MGNAAFYFYGTGQQLITIDLGEGLNELYSDWEIDAQTGVSMSGAMRRVTGLYRERVTIQRDRMSGGLELANKLSALQNHLDRGGACAFTADTDKSFCFPLKTPPSAGDTRLRNYDNPFFQVLGSNTPVIGEFMAIESPNPSALHEIKKIHATTCAGQFAGTIDTSASSPNVSSSDGCAFNHRMGCMTRWYRCWPILKRPQGDTSNIVTNEHGLLYSLNVTLVTDTFIYHRFHPEMQQFNTGLITETVPAEIMTDQSLATLDNPDGDSDDIRQGVTTLFRL